MCKLIQLDFLIQVILDGLSYFYRETEGHSMSKFMMWWLKSDETITAVRQSCPTALDTPLLHQTACDSLIYGLLNEPSSLHKKIWTWLFWFHMAFLNLARRCNNILKCVYVNIKPCLRILKMCHFLGGSVQEQHDNTAEIDPSQANRKPTLRRSRGR